MAAEATFAALLVVMSTRFSLALACSSDVRCKCYYVNSMLTADCRNLRLTKPPIFNVDVQRIDLSYNDLSEIPDNMPLEIVYLNVADNNIKYPKKAILGRYENLHNLDISRNCMWEGLPIWPSRFFENLTKLETLVMRDNCRNLDVTHMKYPKEGFYGLSSLKHIELNGLGQSNFGDAFEKNNSIKVVILSIEGGICTLSNIQKNSLSVFRKATNMTFYSCSLKYIEKGAFADFSELVHLDITKNPQLTLSVLLNITYDLRHSKIQTIIADKIQCLNGLSLILKIEHIINLQNSTLKELSLAGNRIALLEHMLPRYLPKSLKYMNVGDNVFIFGQYLLEGDFLSNLERLDAASVGNYKHDFETGCNYNSNSCDKRTEIPYTTQSRTYYENQNQTYQLPPKLKYFNVANLRMEINRIVAEHGVGFKLKNSLTHIYASGNLFYQIPSVPGLKHLQFIDLSNNFCSNITKLTFLDMDMLSFLNFSRNLLGGILKDQASYDLFTFTPQLKTLDLSNNLITSIPEKLFMFTIGIETLNLSHNEIETISFDLSSALQLREIDLSFNKIVKLDSNSMRKLDAPRHVPLNLNLANNPFTCNCESLDFLGWIKESRNKHFLYLDRYACSFENGTKVHFNKLVQIIASLEQDCRSYTVTIVIVCVLFISMVFVVCLSIAYRYRWKLRYLYYAGKRKFPGYQRLFDDGREYHFDVFASYAENERQLFIPKLMMLEEELGLKFCIHSRDFMPGVMINENITNAIHFSKHTVCFVSNAFLKSEYCMYEIQMARMEGIARGTDDVLLMVVVDGINEEIHNVVNIDRVYLEYCKDNPEEFWNAFAHALREMSF